MLDDILKSNNPLVRYGFASLIVFGSLYFAASVGLMRTDTAWLVSLIIGLMVLMRKVGGERASFKG